MSTHSDIPDYVTPIHWEDLSPEALQGVLEELVTRGEPDEMSTSRRCGQLLKALKDKKLALYFDAQAENVFTAPPV